MNVFEDNKLYTPQEVQKIGKLGKSIFEALVANGTLPIIKISERNRRLKGSTLNKIFSEQ